MKAFERSELTRDSSSALVFSSKNTLAEGYENQTPEPKFGFVVYKISFPNGKIYIGKDVGSKGHSIRYFGSWNYRMVESDFTKEELSDFTIRREILFECNDKQEAGRQEMRLIVELGANDPERGYNRVPKFRA